jgi:lipid A 4'-phosphatase
MSRRSGGSRKRAPAPPDGARPGAPRSMPGQLSRFVDVLRGETREAAVRPVVATLVLLAFVSLLFVALPDLDLAVSRLFYDPATGFLDRRFSFVQTVREAGTIVEWALVVGVCAPLLVKFLFPATRLLLRPRETLFMLASFALGPGLVVNGLLKNHWGRARPRQIVDFGGSATFSPAWWISDQCQRNCSFVSGEAASAFWLVAIVFLVPRDLKLPVGVATAVFAAAVSLARIAAGGHFLSDVLVAWLLVFLVLLLTYRLFIEAMPAPVDTAIEEGVARGGRALRRMLFSWRGD